MFTVNFKSKLLLNIGVIAIVGLAATPVSAMEPYGEPFTGSGFVNQDWQVVCDNTLTCRAAGYADESNFDRPASIMITVYPMQSEATAQLNFYSESEDGLNLNAPTLWLNGKNYGAIGSEFILNTQQTNALVKLARQNAEIEIKAGNLVWRISDKGMASVLLKIDEVQGRVGTPLALVSKDNPNRQTPKIMKSMPIIAKGYAYPEVLNKKLDPKLLTYFQNNIEHWIESSMTSEDASDCYVLGADEPWYDDIESKEWTFFPINNQKTLAKHLCWRAAYNQGDGYWLIDNERPSKPQLITILGSFYADGKILSAHRGRGVGDCWGLTKWQWNGDTFIQSYEATTGLCRGFAGGAWELPTYVSQVIDSTD